MFAIRGPFAALGGALVAVSLFFGLSQLVNVPFVARPLEEGFRIEFTRQIVDTAPDTKRPPKVEPEPPARETTAGTTPAARILPTVDPVPSLSAAPPAPPRRRAVR